MTNETTTGKELQVFTYEPVVKMSRYQPTDIEPVFGTPYLNNGINNINYKYINDAYEDSPTNQSIINAFVNYINGEGLMNVLTKDAKGKPLTWATISQYISDEDVLLLCTDYKKHGGFCVQIIYSFAEIPLRIEYLPIYKMAIGFDNTMTKVIGYWYCWNWAKRFVFKPEYYPKFTGSYKGNNVEVLMVRRPTNEPFFPRPDYLSGIPWAVVEGELSNAAKSHFKNAMSEIVVLNYNNGRMASKDLAKIEADKVRESVCGTDNDSRVIVSFNEDASEAVVVDRVSPPELNQQNVFYSEEAERKLIVAHSAPPILFQGSNSGNGFSNAAAEIAQATRGLYRRHINPMRKVILKGLQPIFDLIGENICLDFKDFEEETELENAE